MGNREGQKNMSDPDINATWLRSWKRILRYQRTKLGGYFFTRDTVTSLDSDKDFFFHFLKLFRFWDSHLYAFHPLHWIAVERTEGKLRRRNLFCFSLFLSKVKEKAFLKQQTRELKSENNQEWWMCPLKHSFGCYPCAPTNGRFHWSSSRNANLLNASQLGTSAQAFSFVYSCLCLAAIPLYRGRGEVTPAHSSIL